MRHSPAPSTRAASRSSFGTASVAKVHIRYSPNGEINEGMITDHGVLVSPIWLNIKKVGTASAVPGTAMAPRTTAKTPRLPGKLNLARAYPPITARNVAPPAPTTTYKRPFRVQRPHTPSLYARVAWMFSHRAQSPENHRPKEENRLSWVLVALTSSQISGTRLYPRTMPVTAVSSGLRRGRSTEGRLLRS